jgi:hypothetical protein
MKSKKQTTTENEIQIETEVFEIVTEIETPEQEPEEKITEQEPEEKTPEQEPEQKTPEQEPEQKKKRGRPKKSDSKNIESSDSDIFASDKEYSDFQKKEQEQKQAQEKNENPVENKTIFNISGEMLLGAIDFTAPLVINTIGGFIEPQLKTIPAHHFMLAEEEKKTLLPAAEAVAKENVRLSPIEMLLGGLLIVYTGKIYQAVNEIRARK